MYYIMQNLIEFNMDSKVAVVCNDAGAANIIIHGLHGKNYRSLRPYMSGPAEKIWSKVFPDIKLCDNLESSLDGADLVITGTGWSSNLEHEARKIARSYGLRSIALLDHWVNYEERFTRLGEKILPDELFVTDQFAFDLAQKIFKDIKTTIVKNYYMESMISEINKLCFDSEKHILYILEPIRNDWGKKGKLGEFYALDYFIECLPKISALKEVKILIRPHPSDYSGKYDDWLSKQKLSNMRLDISDSLSESIAKSFCVVGCESYALVLALMAGRKVYSSIPPWAPRSRLPFEEIIPLHLL